MAKTKNPVATEEVSLSMNAQSIWYLDRLIETGLFGNSRSDAARIAIFDHCKLLIGEGKLAMAPPVAGSTATIVTPVR